MDIETPKNASEILQGLFDREELRSERYINYARIIISFIYLYSAFSIKQGISQDAFNIIFSVALISLLYGLLVIYAFVRYQPSVWLKYPSVMIDIILLSVVLHALGSYGVFKTEAFLLYYLWIGLAILRFSPRMTLLTGMLGLLLYSAVSLDFLTGVTAGMELSRPTQIPLQDEHAGSALRLIFLAMYVAFATYASSVYRQLAQRIIREGLALERNLKLSEAQEKLRDAQKQLAVRNRELATLSEIDALTQLYNRRKIEQLLSDALRHNHPTNSLTAIILLNINSMKSINELYGHGTGDRVLRGAADLLRQAARGGDYIGRWGGGEFLIICQDTGQEEAEAICERLAKRMASYRFGIDMQIVGSFGVAQSRPGDTTNSLLRRGESALYHAKEKGEDQVSAA